jgi:LacI family transcriptional regulator
LKKQKVTIHDIAEQLGVDSSTVSRALMGSSRVKPKTKELIKKAAEEMGYRPNILASNLRRNKTNTVGIIVPRISRHFHSSAIAGIEEVTYEFGYNAIICQSLEKIDREKKLVDTLLANRVDGVLISISMETTEYKHLAQLEDHDIPVVFFDRCWEESQSEKVVSDDREAAFKVTEHLILNGCKRIAHFAGPQTLNIYRDRLKGYLKALKRYDLPESEELILNSKLMSDDGTESASRILEMANPPDGIFSANDTAAISAMQHLTTAGYKIPEDIKVAGFSNEPISAYTNPPLTTIVQSGFEMGKVATKILIDRIQSKGQEHTGKTTTYKSELLIRKSSQNLISAK